MQIAIDFSIFTLAPSAAGVISGKIEFSELPRVGEMISFSFPPNESTFPSVPGINALLKVEHVIHSANGENPALSLQDLVLPSKESVAEVVAFLEKGFGLFFSSGNPRQTL
ncbi:hypothetical protein [Pseudomonas sp. GV071]|uniref:hypothetical protein n=1 Tax=Pseudomonas sp. GV071 TaxID=2135754 RepID=UPI0011B1FC21|nr:hypothetical protein [Pseudomonas sp. GV071]